MEKDKPNITKICRQCAKKMPLSAFSAFGGICNSCKQGKLPEDEESGSSSSGLKVDEKAKKQSDINKRKAAAQVDKEYYHDRANTTQTNVKIEQKQQQTKDAQRSRSFFERNRTAEKTPAKTEKAPAIVGGVEKAAEEARFSPTDTRTAGKEKSKSSIIIGYQRLLGNSAPINQTPSKLTEAANKLADVTRNNWGPRSKK